MKTVYTVLESYLRVPAVKPLWSMVRIAASVTEEPAAGTLVAFAGFGHVLPTVGREFLGSVS